MKLKDIHPNQSFWLSGHTGLRRIIPGKTKFSEDKVLLFCCPFKKGKLDLEKGHYVNSEIEVYTGDDGSIILD